MHVDGRLSFMFAARDFASSLRSSAMTAGWALGCACQDMPRYRPVLIRVHSRLTARIVAASWALTV